MYANAELGVSFSSLCHLTCDVRRWQVPVIRDASFRRFTRKTGIRNFDQRSTPNGSLGLVNMEKDWSGLRWFPHRTIRYVTMSIVLGTGRRRTCVAVLSSLNRRRPRRRHRLSESLSSSSSSSNRASATLTSSSCTQDYSLFAISRSIFILTNWRPAVEHKLAMPMTHTRAINNIICN